MNIEQGILKVEVDLGISTLLIQNSIFIIFFKSYWILAHLIDLELNVYIVP